MEREIAPAQFMKTDEAAAYLGVSNSLLEKLRVRGDGPAYAKVGARVIYLREDLDTFIRGRRVHSTSETEGCSTSPSRFKASRVGRWRPSKLARQSSPSASIHYGGSDNRLHR